MMKKLVLWLTLCALAVGCGAPVEEHDAATAFLEPSTQVEEAGVTDILQGNAELGTAQQEYSAKATTDYQMGVSIAFQRLQCNRTNSLQTCSLLTTKSVSYFIDPASFGPPGTGFNDEIYKYAEDLDTALTTWSFTERVTEEPESTIHYRNMPCTGAYTSNSISAFSCVDLDDTGASIAEGSGVVGAYKTHDDCNCNIDMDDITARGLNLLEELRLLRHATGHCTLACIGLGGRNDSGASNFASRMTVDVNFSPATISSGEKCRAESYSPTNNGAFALITPACSGAN